MHKLMEFICEELEDLEAKVEKDGKLSMAEVEYGDKLAHFKKNLLSSEEIWEDSEYSMANGSYAGGSYANESRAGGSYARGKNRGGGSYARGNRRGGRRGVNQYGSYGMDGYSRASDMTDDLRELMQDAPNEKVRMEFERFINKIDQM